MKITENISLAGYAFVIESDAYNELEKYLTQVHQCFHGNSSADEIVADIEERIAELLTEKCRPGMAVNIMMIQEIINRIGNPDELAPKENAAHNNSYRPNNLNTRNEVRDTDRSSGFSVLKRIGGIILGVILILIGTSGLLSTALFTIVPSFLNILPLEELSDLPFASIPGDTTLWVMMACINALFNIWLLYSGILLTFDVKAPKWRPGLILFISWIVSIIAFISYFIWLFSNQFQTLGV